MAAWRVLLECQHSILEDYSRAGRGELCGTLHLLATYRRGLVGVFKRSELD